MNRFYFESDGDGPKGSRCNDYYVIDSYANPCGPNPPGGEHRTDIVEGVHVKHGASGATMARAARALAAEWNASPPWPVWDTIAAERDGYVEPPKTELLENGQ